MAKVPAFRGPKGKLLRSNIEQLLSRFPALLAHGFATKLVKEKKDVPSPGMKYVMTLPYSDLNFSRMLDYFNVEYGGLVEPRGDHKERVANSTTPAEFYNELKMLQTSMPPT
ncbi:hypothetical protein BDQ17DRAFT_1421107 [Cyathus striatus]|nr:hypothetical protein BDQ17DRAFT_1421107 [Cyathus striatus]